MQRVLAACSHVHFHLILCLLIVWPTSLGQSCQAITAPHRHFAQGEGHHLQLEEPSQGGLQGPLEHWSSPGGLAVPNVTPGGAGKAGMENRISPGRRGQLHSSCQLGALVLHLTGKHCLIVAGEGKLNHPRQRLWPSSEELADPDTEWRRRNVVESRWCQERLEFLSLCGRSVASSRVRIWLCLSFHRGQDLLSKVSFSWTKPECTPAAALNIRSPPDPDSSPRWCALRDHMAQFSMDAWQVL